jgi:hypothetical protein
MKVLYEYVKVGVNRWWVIDWQVKKVLYDRFESEEAS